MLGRGLEKHGTGRQERRELDRAAWRALVGREGESSRARGSSALLFCPSALCSSALHNALCSQDLWMFPNILMFHPEAARALLQYRIRTLSGALDNARKLGYQVRGPGPPAYRAPTWPGAPPPRASSLTQPPSTGRAGMSRVPLGG